MKRNARICSHIARSLLWILLVALVAVTLPGAAAAADVNLVLSPAAGWSYPVVPNDYDTSTPTSCVLPPTLWTTNGYWNAHGENLGADPTPGGFDVTYFVDGQTRAMAYAAATSGDFFILNEGPGNYIDPGVHTIHCYVDAFHSVIETDETDNFWGRQYWGLSSTLPIDHTAWEKAAPPLRTGGWGYISDGSTPQDNCHGYLVFTGSGGQAVVAAPTEAADDFDLRLYAGIDQSGTVLPENPEIASSRAAGCLEAVFVFAGGQDYTATVVNMNEGDGNYITFREGDTGLQLGEPDYFYMLPDHLLRLFDYTVAPENQGWIRATVETDPGVDLRVATLDPNGATYMNLDDASATAVADADGVAVLSWQVFDGEQHFVTVYREGLDLPETGIGFTITLEHPDAVADLAPAGEDWWSPLVPSSVHQASGPVTLPALLTGNAASTYYNFQFRNAGYAGSGSMTNRIYLDGVGGVPILYLGGVGAQVESTYLGAAAQTVRGGRHTLGVVYDVYDGVPESDETNNSYGEQFCWTPLELTYGASISRPAPPDPLATTDLVPAGVTVYPNCDGLRMPDVDLTFRKSGWWRGVAAMPAAADHVDLAVHKPSSGPKSGFAKANTWTSATAGDLAYVAVNYHQSNHNDYDVGLRRGTSCSSEVTVEAVASVWVDASAGGAFGPYSLGVNHSLDLLDLQLDAGRYALRVDNLSGVGRLMMTLHDAAAGFVSCTAGIVPGGVDAASEDGGPAYFTVDLAEAGYYGLAVWKRSAEDLDLDISYRLRIQPGISATQEPPAAARTGLVGAFPNPFNPRTRIVYELSERQPVELALFDVKGRRIRLLWSGSREAGRHEEVWDGLDDRGRPLGSGVYLARLVHGNGTSLQRLTLVR